MKTIKQENLSVLSRTYVYKRGHLLLVAAFAGFHFSCPEKLIDEGDIWAAGEASLGENDYLDQGFPRLSGEVILHARCYTPEGKSMQACPVSFRLGSIKKELYVFGDRHWNRTAGVYTGISDPVPFTSMDITWENAFGGEGYKLNPRGKGAIEIKDSAGHSYLPLPNIEDPRDLVCAAGKKYKPISFDYIGPERTASEEIDKLGTYDEKWLIYNWPYMPDDFDLQAGYAAPGDQRLKEGFFNGDEEVVLKNMHPKKSAIKTKLPGIRVRGFFKGSRFEKRFFEELTMELDKIWIFPHLETGILVWHALTSIADEEASEVTDLVVFSERLDEPAKPASYYEAMTEQTETDGAPEELSVVRSEEALKAEKAVPTDSGAKMAAAGIITAAAGLAAADVKEYEEAHAMLIEVQKDIAGKEAELDKMLKDLGVEYGEPKEGKPHREPAAFEAVSPEEMLKNIENSKGEAEEKLNKIFSGLGVDVNAQLPLYEPLPIKNPNEIIESLKSAGVEDAGLFGMILGLGAEYAALKIGIEKLMKEAENIRKTSVPDEKADIREPEAPPEPEKTLFTREDVLAGYKAGEKFDGFDLTGIDLSGCVLTGISLRGSMLEKANLADADLSGADLTEAILTGADISKCKMPGADLSGISASRIKAKEADLFSARLNSADLSQADLSQAVLTKAILDEADLEGALMKGSCCDEMSGRDAVFTGANFTDADMSGAVLVKADLRETAISNCKFWRADLREADFSGAKGEGTSFTEAKMAQTRAGEDTAFKKSDFSGADISSSSWQESSFEDCAFVNAALYDAVFIKCCFAGSNFSGADAKRTRFDYSDLSDVNMTGINLFNGSLRKAVLVRSDLSNSNLFAVEFYKAVFRDTNIQGANVKRTFFERYTPDGKTTWRWTHEKETV